MSSQAILGKINYLLSERLAKTPTRGDNQQLSVAIYDLHNSTPNIELFNIWQALSQAKKDPARFEQGVGRLTAYLQSSGITSAVPALRGTAGFYNQSVTNKDGLRSVTPVLHPAPTPASSNAPRSSITVERIGPGRLNFTAILSMYTS